MVDIYSRLCIVEDVPAIDGCTGTVKVKAIEGSNPINSPDDCLMVEFLWFLKLATFLALVLITTATCH